MRRKEQSLIDQIGNEIPYNKVPKRIISLVPSQTELLAYFQLDSEVVGITKFCIHPCTWYKSKTRIGGTKQINLDKINALNPDLIIGNKEENTQEDILALQEICPVYISDVNTFDDALQMIDDIGRITHKKASASELIEELKSIAKKNKQTQEQRTAIYLIWKNPYIAVGTDTFINDMLQYAGYKNLIKTSRYPEIDLAEIQKLKPKELLLSTEPYPFVYKDIEELNKTLKDTKIRLVDGEMFSWYGSRLLKSFSYFKQINSDSD